MFIKTWMAYAHGENNNQIVRPQFASAKIFPPKKIEGYDPTREMTFHNITTKRFVFDASSIETLRATNEKTNKSLLANQRRPSRVDIVSAFIWSSFMATVIEPELSSRKLEKLYTVSQAINLCPKFDPPLPDYSFGNYYSIATVVSPLSSGKESSSWVIKKLKEEIRKDFKNYVEKLQCMERNTWYLSKKGIVLKRLFYFSSQGCVGFLFMKLTLDLESLFGCLQPLGLFKIWLVLWTQKREMELRHIFALRMNIWLSLKLTKSF